MYSSVNSMRTYMLAIAEISLISVADEVVLAGLIKEGDAAARQKLISANLRLVVKIAHDFKGLGVSLEDLVAEGNIGLMRAVERFDPEKGAKFSSYSAWWIKQAMRKSISTQGRTIRIPIQSRSKSSLIITTQTRLKEQLGRSPTSREIALKLGYTERTVRNLLTANISVCSINAPINVGEDGDFLELIPDQNAPKPDVVLGDREELKRMFSYMTKLSEREQLILDLRYGLSGKNAKTLDEVSSAIGRTRERVRQIQNHALKKLKAFITSDEPVLTF
ncbi:MAG: RNA polymerase sigma factor RpoD/SigA [Lentisphaeria bacterium]|nr:RNA polymerase sigma factor RpoD/SigA [Lentisphaeria bacterium]